MTFRSAARQIGALALCMVMTQAVLTGLMASPVHAYSSSGRYFDGQEIEQLTAPIALYPDPLLAQILSAAAYPDEIAQAQRFMEQQNDDTAIDRQDWNPSVRVIARYREVLDLLAGDLEWTEALGIAHINQPDQVAEAIQRWRLQAYELGSLRTNAEQIVYVDGGYIRIVPAHSDYFYIPAYDPQVIYVDRYIPGYPPFLIFGRRYAISPWFDMDWDWRRRRICYSDRDRWRNGRPVFHPQFDRVYVDRNRLWEPDHKRFHPPESPKFPVLSRGVRVPPPPSDIKSGVRRSSHPVDSKGEPTAPVLAPRGKPDGRPAATPAPAVQRGTGRDGKPATGSPQPAVAPPVRHSVPPPEKTPPPKVEPQKSAPGPQPQPARQAPPARRLDEESGGPPERRR